MEDKASSLIKSNSILRSWQAMAERIGLQEKSREALSWEAYSLLGWRLPLAKS